MPVSCALILKPNPENNKNRKRVKNFFFLFIFILLENIPENKYRLKMNYWLFKSEPSEFSWDDLKKSKNQITFWDAVRNYQARNYLRDEIKKGDGVLFYQSSTEPLTVVGCCEVVKEGYSDHTQFDPDNHYYDPKADKKNPTWFMIDIKLKKEFSHAVTLASIKS